MPPSWFWLALFFFLIPRSCHRLDLSDPNIRSAGIPRSAWKLHRDLSPQFERWARQRLDSKRAAELPTSNISGTEWPLFGTVFYLWATESLQDEWEKGHLPTPSRRKFMPGAPSRLRHVWSWIPTQANWVKIHWGKNYLKTENVFYRMLVIAALTSHARLTGDKEYLPLLKDQVDSLSAELDASRHGLLDDYPGQCFPGDVLTAIAMIHRADKVLGTDHSAFVSRAIRGFQNQALDSRGLVPYFADASLGEPIGPSRGCGNSYVSLFAPEIWPEQARKWYDLYSRYFWQETWTCAGFREFPKDLPGNDWDLDVDSGLVLKGFGCAACAFGVGAARVNGHFEHAYPLTAEMLVTSWPLPNGTGSFPRLLSNAADAPCLGEAAILFNLTRLPAEGVHQDRRFDAGVRPDFSGTAIWIWPGGVDGSNHVIPSVAETPRLDDSSTTRNTIWNLGRVAGRLRPLPVVWQNASRDVFLACAQLLPRYQRKRCAVVGTTGNQACRCMKLIH